MKGKIFSSVLYVFTAQGMGFLLSMLLTLLIPKIVGIEQFGYWQLFLLYASYIGFFTLGFNDGFYLKYGGVKVDQVDHNVINPQFLLYLILQVGFVIIMFFIALLFEDPNKKFIFIVLAFNVIIQNTNNFFGFVFQATARFKNFSASVLIDKVFFLFSIIALAFLKVQTFHWFLIFYSISKILALFYSLRMSKSFLNFGSFKHFRESVDLTTAGFKDACIVGSSLMISNIVSGLIIGFDRIIVENEWGIETFSKVSLALSLTAFFLLFISQIGIVLFPFLRNKDLQGNTITYFKLKALLACILPLMFVLYYPLRIVLLVWLPNYYESIRYLVLLLPICLFEGKFFLLYSTYFKVYRLERKLLFTNVITFLCSIVLCILGVYLLKSLEFILVSIVFSLLLRCVISEIFLKAIVKRIDSFALMIEVALTVAFIYLNRGYAIERNMVYFLSALGFYYVLAIFNYKTELFSFLNKQVSNDKV